MISVKDAIQKVEDSVTPLKSVRVNLIDALGFTISDDIYSPISFPPFEQSAMDGYAICSENGSLDYPVMDILKEVTRLRILFFQKGSRAEFLLAL